MTMPALIPLGSHTGKPPIPLRRPVLLIGSRNIAHLHLLSSKVSKAHALIINSDGKIYIRDLASRTHVYVNGQQVREANLKHNDLIKIGSFVFRLAIPSAWQTRPRDSKADPAQLEVEGADLPVRLDQRVILIGRRPTCDVSLLEDSASTAHAVIFEMGGRRFIRDLGSRTGTFVNGRSVHQEELDFGDTIRIGETEFRYAPAPAMPVGPVPADQLDTDFDELEDLVGTAPLMEEPPEVIAKRLEQESAARAQNAKAAQLEPQELEPRDLEHADSRAPIPLDDDLDLEAEAPAAPEPEEEAPPIQPVEAAAEPVPAEAAELDLASEEAHAEEELDLAPAPGAEIDIDTSAEVEAETETEQVEAKPEVEAEPEPEVEAEAEVDAEIEPQAASAAVDDLPGLDLDDEQGLDQQDLPPTEVEIDLAGDLELEAEPHEHDPEATRALPPELKPRSRRTPAISADIVDEPVVAQPAAEAPDEPELPVEDASEPEDEPADAASDTVALAAAALAETPEDTDTTDATDADADALDLAPAEQDIAEDDLRHAPASEIDEQTVEPTLPTPESAQSLEPALSVSAEPTDTDDLTDTGFDREVHAFVAESPEPVDEVIETDDDQPQTIPVSEDDLQAVDHDQPAEDADEVEDTAGALADLDLDLSDTTEEVIEEVDEDAAEPVAVDTADTDEEALSDELDLGPLPTAELEVAVEDEPDQTPAVDETPSPQPSAETKTSAPPAPEQDRESFPHGVNQWGFLGGSPLVLNDLPTPPPPARGGRAKPRPSQEAPFGKQPLPVDDLSAADVSDPFAAAPSGPLPQISEIDVFSQLGAPPDDDPLFGAAALGHVKAGAAPLPEIPPTDSGTTDAASSPELADAQPLDQQEDEHEDDTDPQWDQPAADQPAASADEADELSDDPFEDLEIEDAAPTDAADLPLDEEDQDATDDQPAAENAAEPTPVHKPVVPIPPSRNGSNKPAVLFDEPKRRRKRRWFFTVPSLFVMMLIFAAAAAGAIWYTVPTYGVVNGWLKFENLDALSGNSRLVFYRAQANLLADTNTQELATTRASAKGRLADRYRDTSPGFLDDPAKFAMLVEESSRTWADARDDTLTLHLSHSFDPAGDARRLHALLLALYDRNTRLIDARNNLHHDIAKIAADLRVIEKKITIKQDQLQRHGDESRPPTEAELAAIERDIARLDAERRAAEDAVRAVQSEIERMREVATRDAVAQQDGNPQPVAMDDPELRQMQESLDRLNQRLQVATVADNLEIERTRELMDASIAQLEHQIEQVKKQMADVPEMKGYVTVAKLLQDTTHQITNELIHSQKQQLETINSLKRKLDQQLVARQNEVWENDPDLKNLTALLDIQRRHYNAAVASEHASAKQNMDELAASIAQLEQQIEDRRRVLGNDTIYADAIRGLQELIATSQKRLEEDQKRAEQQIAKMQQALAEAAPDLQKLPEEQKKLAAELERRLVEMNDARKAYSDALARASADGGAQRREMESQALALQARIDARRQELLATRLKTLSEQQQKKIRTQIQAKTDQLNKLQAAARDANNAYMNRNRELAVLADRAQNADASAADRERIARELATLQIDRDQLAAKKTSLEEQLAAAVYPVEPTALDQHVTISEVRDDRPYYALLAVASVALLFGMLMLVAHHSHARQNAMSQRITAVEPPLFPSRDTLDDFVPEPPHVEEPSTA